MPLMVVVEIGDKIKIGTDIEIIYAKRLGRKAGIAIAAPSEIKIIRVPTNKPQAKVESNAKNSDR